ncbi:hypothetical protein EWM64_g7854 [Hericium alpestre]|uniref:BTB domain-containing protein n=1 Tax=Hericium alpestre TaxID=135208 RepID=A0A4Y9ZRP4_9AGAM|nr:hypothetical protein EWM64_g7854 [Hericium alpestre]
MLPQVEDRLFRIHRFFLQKESPVFRDMLSLPQPPGDDSTVIRELEGRSDSRPIHIPDVTILEFRTLLEMLYKPPCIYPKFSQEQWLMLMSVAHRFQVPINYAHVMKMLETSTPRLDDVAQVKLAEEYGMPMSCIRPALLSNAREEYLRKVYGATGRKYIQDLEIDGSTVVKKVFGVARI